MNTRIRLLAAATQLKETFVGRDEAIDCIMLALATGANFILVGDAGTGKSALVRRAFSHVSEARQFGILCGAFASEDKMFGPTDIKAFHDGRWGRVIKDRLADCELAFLDEVMKTNDGTLNSMLGVLNEREYDGQPAPLWTCGAATNWPEVRGRSENVAALWDRFLLRCRVDCLTEPAARVKMIGAAEAVRNYTPRSLVTVAELQAAREEIRAVKMKPAFVGMVVDVASRLEKEQVALSDRRLAMLMLVAQASAWLSARDKVNADDVDALRFGLWTDEPHIPVVNVVLDSVDVEVKKHCLRTLATAQARFAKNVGVGDAKTVLDNAWNAAKEVGPLMTAGNMRSVTRKAVQAELDRLRESFLKVHDQYASLATGDKKPKRVKAGKYADAMDGEAAPEFFNPDNKY